MAIDWRRLLFRRKARHPATSPKARRPPASESTLLSPPEAPPTAPQPAKAKTASKTIAAGQSASDVRGPETDPTSSDASAHPSLDRNGIPVFGPGDDLDRRMLEQAPKALPRDARANDRPPKSPPPVRRKRRPRSASGGPAGRSQVNRHGLPVLTAGDDWQQRWQASEAGDRPAREPATVQANRTDDCQRTDKHGIPVLDDCHDLGRLLTASEEKSPADNDLVEAFQQSIDHDARTLIKKKTDGHFPVRQLTLKERLQRYPQPQRQLDLHGLKALQAQQRADHFIRAAHADGLFTLRIIVGKGLHSESGAVLPDVVEDRLIRLKRDGLVLAYRWEKGVKRKSGAVLVFIDPPF